MPLRVKTFQCSLDQERELREQTFRNMVWFYREALLEVDDGYSMQHIGLSKGEISNLKRQDIITLTSSKNEKISLLGRYRPGNGRVYVLTEKAKMVLREIAKSEK